MATVLRKGKKRIITNNGSVQIDIDGNRVLHYDGTNYRFVVGDKTDSENKVVLSKENENVLNV